MAASGRRLLAEEVDESGDDAAQNGEGADQLGNFAEAAAPRQAVPPGDDIFALDGGIAGGAADHVRLPERDIRAALLMNDRPHVHRIAHGEAALATRALEFPAGFHFHFPPRPSGKASQPWTRSPAR